MQHALLAPYPLPKVDDKGLRGLLLFGTGSFEERLVTDAVGSVAQYIQDYLCKTTSARKDNGSKIVQSLTEDSGVEIIAIHAAPDN